MRNYLFSLIVCYTLIAPAFAKQPHYVEGKLVNYANPVYPRQAMENEEEGTVKLRIFVAPDNSVKQVEIVGFTAVRQSRHRRRTPISFSGCHARRQTGSHHALAQFYI